MMRVKGACHCGNISLTIDLSKTVEEIQPRACDCDFCLKHGASWLSDPAGQLEISLSDKKAIGHYHQGSGAADFLFCTKCAVLIGVSYQEGDQIFMGINSRIILEKNFKEPVTVSPKKLQAPEKVKRWKEVWFSRITFS